MFKIEKGISIPSPRHSGFTETLRHMKVGESFVYPRAALPGIYTMAKNVGCKVMYRTQPDGTCRVWLLESAGKPAKAAALAKKAR